MQMNRDILSIFVGIVLFLSIFASHCPGQIFYSKTAQEIYNRNLNVKKYSKNYDENYFNEQVQQEVYEDIKRSVSYSKYRYSADAVKKVVEKGSNIEKPKIEQRITNNSLTLEAAYFKVEKLLKEKKYDDARKTLVNVNKRYMDIKKYLNPESKIVQRNKLAWLNLDYVKIEDSIEEGNYSAAASLFKDLTHKKTFGELSHDSKIDYYRRVGEFFASAKQYSEAIVNYEDLVTIYKILMKSNKNREYTDGYLDDIARSCRIRLCELYTLNKTPEKIMRMYEELIMYYNTLYGENDFRVIKTKVEMSAILYNFGQMEQSKQYYQDPFKAYKRARLNTSIKILENNTTSLFAIAEAYYKIQNKEMERSNFVGEQLTNGLMNNLQRKDTLIRLDTAPNNVDLEWRICSICANLNYLLTRGMDKKIVSRRNEDVVKVNYDKSSWDMKKITKYITDLEKLVSENVLQKDFYINIFTELGVCFYECDMPEEACFFFKCVDEILSKMELDKSCDYLNVKIYSASSYYKIGMKNNNEDSKEKGIQTFLEIFKEDRFGRSIWKDQLMQTLAVRYKKRIAHKLQIELIAGFYEIFHFWGVADIIRKSAPLFFDGATPESTSELDVFVLLMKRITKESQAAKGGYYTSEWEPETDEAMIEVIKKSLLRKSPGCFFDVVEKFQ